MTTSQSFYRNQEGKISVSSLVGFWFIFVSFFCLNLLISYGYTRNEEYFGSFLSIITGGCSILVLLDVFGYFRHDSFDTVLNSIWLTNQIVSFGYLFQTNLPKEWQWKYGHNLGISATFNMAFILALDVYRNPDYYTRKLLSQSSDPTDNDVKETYLASAIRLVNNIGLFGWYSGYSLQFVLDQHFAAALLCICSAGFMLLRKLEKERYICSLGEQFDTNFNHICTLNLLVTLLFLQFLLPTALQSTYIHTLAACASTNVFLTFLLRLRADPTKNDAKTSPSSQLHTEAAGNI